MLRKINIIFVGIVLLINVDNLFAQRKVTQRAIDRLQKQKCVTPPSGMTAWFPFDEPSGDTTANLISGGNSGSVIGSPQRGLGKVSNAIKFNSTSQYVRVDSQSQLNVGTGNFSIDAWIRMSSKAEDGARQILRKIYSTGYMLLTINNRLALVLKDSMGQSIYNAALSSPNLADDKWHHIAVTVDRNNPNGVIFYVDGVNVGSANPTDRVGSLSGSQSLIIAQNFPGDVDEVEIFKQVLSAAEVKSLYAAQGEGKCKTNTGKGTVTFNPIESDCEKGSVCFDYTISATPGLPGTIELKLSLFQNGMYVTSLTSGNLNSDGTFCFDDVPDGLDASVGGFDWVLVANFINPGVLPYQEVLGAQGDGYLPGKNNDCKIREKKPCCGVGRNYVGDGSFSGELVPFMQYYKYTNSLNILPGYLGIINSDKAKKVCSNWNITGHSGANCKKGNKDRFLAINGLTNQSSSVPKPVWGQKVKVDGEGEYHFCAYFRNLKQCCFDQKPRITIQATLPNGQVFKEPATISTDPNNPCDWQLVSTTINAPAGTSMMDLKILLDESAVGDGNDFAVDDISLTKKPPVDPNALAVQQASFNVTATQYSLRLTAPALPTSDCKRSWKAVEVDSNDNPIPGTEQQWGNVNPNVFNGYGSSLNLPGVFKSNKRYVVTYEVECDCYQKSSKSWLLSYLKSRKKPTFKLLKKSRASKFR